MTTLISEYKALLEKQAELKTAIEIAEEKMVMATELQQPLIIKFLDVFGNNLSKQYSNVDYVLEYLKHNLVCVPMFCTESWSTENNAKDSITLYYKLSNGESVMYTFVNHDTDDPVNFFGRDGPDEEVYEDLPDSWQHSDSLKKHTKSVMKQLNKLKNRGLPHNLRELPKELEQFWLLLLICQTDLQLSEEKLVDCIDYCAYVDELSGYYEDSESEESEESNN